MIREQLPDAIVFDLLDADVYGDLLRRPRLLGERTQGSEQVVVIDEIQKLPLLLDEVHRLIELENRTFLLTGSSARKLKHGGANLLAGRAWTASLFPLTYNEIEDFDLSRYVNHGGLPQVYDSEYPREELNSYVNTYLKEEIQSEAVTRNLRAFSQFLDAIALSNGEELNYESFSSDCQVSAGTLRNYVQILEDTLLGFRLPGYTKTRKRKAISRAKHYLFDIGVTNSLCRRGKVEQKSELFGRVFEHFIILEARAYLSYSRSNLTMSYWRSTSQFEVNLILGNEIAIEVKATDLVQNKHLKGLRAFKEEKIASRYIVVSQDSSRRVTEDGVEILPWRKFLEQLWEGQIVSDP